MAVNDVRNGGSFYLQSKIYRAKEMLDEYEVEKKNAVNDELHQREAGSDDNSNEEKK
jgi:mitochondrial import inner membrane translocase subunit TIM16